MWVSELPLTSEELAEFFVADKDFLVALEEMGLIRKTSKGWIHVGKGSPAWKISLDQISSSSYKVLHNNYLLEEMDRQHAYSEAHEGADSLTREKPIL